jgi:hypothetical protein
VGALGIVDVFGSPLTHEPMLIAPSTPPMFACTTRFPATRETVNVFVATPFDPVVVVEAPNLSCAPLGALVIAHVTTTPGTPVPDAPATVADSEYWPHVSPATWPLVTPATWPVTVMFTEIGLL